MKKEQTERIRDAVSGRWLEVFGQIAPELEPAIAKLGRHVFCPVHGGNHGDGFRLFKDASNTGGGICNTCGNFSNGWSLLMWLKGWNYQQTLVEVGRCLGIGDGIPASIRRGRLPRRTSQKPARTVTGIRERLGAILTATVPITDRAAKPLWRYWSMRGIPAGRVAQAIPRHDRVLRFHRELPYFTQDEETGKSMLVGVYPALVSIVHDGRGKAVTVHRTYLSRDGRKADVPGGARKLYPVIENGVLRGGAIRLGRPGVCMGVAEGIETALSVMLATGEPVWSVLNASLLAQWTPPKKVSHVTIWADRDRSRVGEEYARRLKTRLQKMGISVRVMIPGGPIPQDMSGIDWNDVWRAYGADGFNQGWWRRLLRKTG